MGASLEVDSRAGLLRAGDATIPCALGKAGVISAEVKREGDGCTPLGQWPVRALYARPDRVPALATALPLTWLNAGMGWCDDPADPHYNRPVPLPCTASHERLWREDGLYDLIIVLGHNDAPPVPGLGSAIFLHCCKYDDTGIRRPTLGCVAIDKAALLSLLPALTTTSILTIR
jgi:L,D-peptidoglycan transpeptidase YkuD (ErfK/YbiS/YcfS/YnhG family)